VVKPSHWTLGSRYARELDDSLLLSGVNVEERSGEGQTWLTSIHQQSNSGFKEIFNNTNSRDSVANPNASATNSARRRPVI
jgi:hypothetical protein